MRRMTRLLCVIALMLSITMMPSAYAASGNCSFSISNISFGSVSTLSPSPVDVTATLSATCSGFSASVVQICAASLGYPSGGTARQMTAGSDTLTYQLFSDSGRQSVWGSVYGNAAPAPTMSIPLSNGSGVAAFPVYARLYSGQPMAPSGGYSDAYGGQNAEIRYYGGDSGSQACAIGTVSSFEASFNVLATVIPDCDMTVQQGFAFPSTGLITTPLDVSFQLAATCTNRSSYAISMDDGASGGGPSRVDQRYLMPVGGGTGSMVAYNLYLDHSASQVWGDGTRGTRVLNGVGTGQQQVYVGYGRVPPQTTPAPGAYAAQINVTISY